MKFLRKSLVLISILIVGSLATAFGLMNASLDQQLNLEEPDRLMVERGSSLIQIATKLKSRNWIDNDLWVRVYAKLNPKATKIHVGEYQVDPEMTLRSLLEKLASGDVVVYQVSLIEGWTFMQAVNHLKSIDVLQDDLPGSQFEIAKFIGIEGHPEGKIFPASYQYTRNEKISSILKRAHLQLEKVLDEEWQSATVGELPYQDAYDALIMASIVEKETGVPEERNEIAGVFVRRLNKNMRLQTDPTVIYGMGDRYNGNIRKRDLKEVTPYNTYRINGLPPTPIALVGREAIQAALNPKDGDTLYFVAKGDGSHYFSKTLEEHLKAVREYQLRNRREDYRSAPTKVDE